MLYKHIKDCIKPNGNLYSLGWYLYWEKDSRDATLDGEFTIEELEEILHYMKAHTAKDKGLAT